MRRLLASWFGSGLVLRHLRGSDGGSGTLAALLTFPAVLLLARSGWVAQLAAAIVVTLLSVWTSKSFAHDDSGHADPGWVVIDEAAGTLVATIGLGGWPALIGVAVFRLADIFKSMFPGVRAAESLPGGIGITADDTVAGLYGLLVGWGAASWLF